ncbi:hypothetical protein UK23_11040 [Lentzea aerocolonigenes]|uniref:Uncharacterized protein n=1 Tax=Lentzea aerocolonigenes TaxID=68170 RepID=A0A0F0H7N5_LENAE|nr:hypothetical protein [Lentzea aerocolonigenes]KJK50342.1 hypothetical protein UK23_11040 [Lentzea aerocolonigenes]
MPIEVASKRRKQTRQGAVVIDVTSRGPDPWVRFSPFYPHGGIPVPMSPGVLSASVEGVWQALKVFESSDVDASKLAVTSMKGLKRTVRRFGPVRGHRAGLDGDHLLDYRTARHEIYLPTYRWVLENRLQDLVSELCHLAESEAVVLLDYTTNGDPGDLKTPLSHAALIAAHCTNG